MDINLKQELCILSSPLLMLAGIIYFKGNLIFSLILSVIFFMLIAFAISNRDTNRLTKIIFSILSPFFLLILHLWCLYLIKNTNMFAQLLHSSYKRILFLGLISDMLYCKLIPLKTFASQSQIPDDNIIITNNHETQDSNERDVYFAEAGKFIIEQGKASAGLLQRMFKIGFNRAENIMDQLTEAGVVGEESRTKSRKILMSMKEFEDFLEYHPIQDPRKKGSSSYQTDKIDLYNDEFDYMNGHDFEFYCAGLLEKNGYFDIKVTQSTGDYGADILATRDGIKYAIQCKCYSENVGIDAVYQISGGMKYYNANIGIVLTNRYFTKQAEALANTTGIILWDRDFLINLAKNNASATT